MKKTFIITCVTSILTMLAMTCLLELNKTDEVIKTIEEQEETAPVYNNYETHNHYERKEVIIEREVIVEKEEEPSKSEATEDSNTSANENEQHVQQNQPKINDGICTPSTVLRCEVCEQTGTELKVWYDSTGLKHYTCTTRCTEGLGVLYGE